MDAELRFHVEAYAEDLIKRGIAPDVAHRRARAEFGSIEHYKDDCRDARGITLVSSFVQDVRYGLRTWRRNPAFTATAVLTLALGIGANATIFSWVRTILLNPLPGAVDADRVMALEMLTPSHESTETSYLDFIDFRDHLSTIESMSVAQPLALAVGSDTVVERVWGELLSGNGFELLRVQPELGRFFTGSERDDVQNAHAVVVISHDYWTSHFREGDQVIGATLQINRQRYEIIGVAPRNFHGTMPGLTFDMWVPATMYGSLTSTGSWMLNDRKTRMFRVLARLAPGVSPTAGSRRTDGARGADGRARCGHECRHERDAVALLAISLRPAGSVARAAHLADGRQRPRLAHRLRQRREPVARARDEPATRVRRAHRAGRPARPARAPTAHGGAAPERRRVDWRARARDVARRLAALAVAVEHAPDRARAVRRRRRTALHRDARVSHRGARGHRARLHRVARDGTRRAQRGRPDRRAGRRVRAVARPARRDGSRAGGGRARRRRPVPQELLSCADHPARLRREPRRRRAPQPLGRRVRRQGG